MISKTTQKVRLAAALISAVASFTLMTGCTASDVQLDGSAYVKSLAVQVEEAGSPENAAALADGKLTEDELFQSARRYQECLSALGIQLPEPVLSPIDRVTLVFDDAQIGSLAGDAVTKANRCMNQWTPVSAAFVRTHESQMEPILVADVAKCMKGKSYDVPSDASKVADFVGDDEQSTDQRSAAEACIVDGAQRLFPELANIVVQY